MKIRLLTIFSVILLAKFRCLNPYLLLIEINTECGYFVDLQRRVFHPLDSPLTLFGGLNNLQLFMGFMGKCDLQWVRKR